MQVTNYTFWYFSMQVTKHQRCSFLPMLGLAAAAAAAAAAILSRLQLSGCVAICNLCVYALLSLHTWLAVQEFNRGLFDFLIATDDPAKQASGNATDTAADTLTDTAAEPAGELAAASSQLPDEQDKAGGGSDQVQGQELDHPWAESAATAQSFKVGTWPSQRMTCFFYCSQYQNAKR